LAPIQRHLVIDCYSIHIDSEATSKAGSATP